MAALLTLALGCGTAAGPVLERNGGTSGTDGPGGNATDPEPSSSGGTSPAESRDGGKGGASDSGTSAPASNGFPAKWIDGTSCAEPKIQTWEFAKNTFILRQSLCTNYEGPFMYLFVGGAKALLVDTGTGAVDVHAAVTELLAGANVELIVAHSHSHGDHVGGDGAFRNAAKTTVVGTGVNAVKSFFGLGASDASTVDLGGGRELDVLAIPGHQAAHVAFYDRQTKLLLTGDTLYPGRLYIDDWTAYRSSVARLVDFVDAGHSPSWVLGAHIELSKTGSEFSVGTKQHPDEHPLQLTELQLRELNTAVQKMGATPRREVHDDFIVDP